MAFIDLKDVSKQFGSRRVLANINLAVEEGEFVCVVGASASGKTTLVKILTGLVAPDTGSVTIGGQAVTSFPSSASIVFQNYSLLPWFSALENVRLGVESAFPDWPAAKQKDQAMKYLHLVGLGNAYAKRPGQLSGGMRQRVAIARAFAVEPRVLFLDEPFGALDALTRATLQQELARLCDEQKPKATVLMITNSVDEAILLSDRILALGRRGSGKDAATLSMAAPVTLARPRASDLLMHNEEAVRIRARVTDLLTSGASRNRAARQVASVVMSDARVEVCSK
ncbi:MAG: ABC transporter ATP-binding protein [Acidobacteriota bacterium]|nr:ABC transporter ATP-binding protein [Acidobacteriota bacterium]